MCKKQNNDIILYHKLDFCLHLQTLFNATNTVEMRRLHTPPLSWI